MTRPVIFGGSVCALLLAGLIIRPTIWSGSPHTSERSQRQPVVAVTSDAPDPERVAAHTPRQSPDHYPALSQVELQREAEVLWRRAIEIQTQLHDETSPDKRQELLVLLEDVVDRSNTLQALLQN